MKKAWGIILAGALLASSAQAGPSLADVAKNARMAGVQCSDGMQETVNLSVSFNMKAKSFAEAKTIFDQKMQQLNDYARQQKVGKFELQSMNYNINAQVTYEGGMPEQGYQLSGSANYNLDSSDAAFKLAEFLTQQKFQVNVGVNKYRNASCNNQQ